MIKYKCPFCGSELKDTNSCIEEADEYFCNCRNCLIFRRYWITSDLMISHYYAKKLFSNKLKYVEKVFQEKDLRIKG